MKKKFKYFITHPMLFVFVIILIFFTPLALFSPGENKNRGIVIAIGIDKQEEYEVSLLTFIPTVNQTYKEQTSIITGNGDSLAKALYNAQISMGRKIGLAHAKTTVVSESMLEEDVASSIDYLSRVASLPENTVFISTDKSAKELLESSENLVNKTGLKLEQVINYNAKNLYITDTSLEAFYKGYYGITNSSLMGFLKTKTEDASKENSQSSSAGSESSQSENQSKSMTEVENDGQAILLKNGKKVENLTVDQLNGINMLNQKSKNQIIKIYDVEKSGENVNLVYRIVNKKILTNTSFENGYPLYVCQLILNMDLAEIEGEHQSLKIPTEFSEITEDVSTKLVSEIKKQFTNSLNLLRENKTDVIGINKSFYKNNRKDYENFIKEHGGEDEFLNQVIFKLNIIVQPE